MSLQRIGELAIDIVNYLINNKKLGFLQGSADVFVLRQKAGLIPEDLMKRMKGMVEFRNIVVHEYQRI